MAAAAVLLLLSNGAPRAAADIVLRAADAAPIHGTWAVVPDVSAAGGSRLANPDQGRPKLSAPLSSPEDFVELTFAADAGVAYRIWIRGKAQGDAYYNDSVWLQFSDSVDAAGVPRWRIGTTSATSVVLEDCVHCGLSGWGWQDNGYGTLGEPVSFAASGMHTLRIQVREDGLSIDQIVLSPDTYFSRAPGAAKDDTTILIGESSPTSPDALVRGPYLQQVGARDATLVWATRRAGAGAAEVGSSVFPALTTFLPASATGLAEDTFQHEARITGLVPASTYAYWLLEEDSPITDGSDRLTTAPRTGSGSVRFIAFGDSGTGSAEQWALAARMEADAFDFALHTGDVVYGSTDGTGAATHATYQSWFFDVYRGWLRYRPVFPSMGNHDSREANDWGRAYLDLFALPTHGVGTYPDHAERFYSFDYGPVHVVAIDTELAFQDPERRAAQLAWLDADLAAAAAQPWKVAVFHRSPFSAGVRQASDLTVRQALAPIFERRGVHLSVSGHAHVYERSVPWRTGADPHTQAVTYVVTGGGGGPLYATGVDEWTAVSASRHHYLRVTIEGCTATLEAVTASGGVFDAHVLDRCVQALDAAPPSVSFVTPSSGASLTGSVTVEAFATDDTRVEKVDLWIDGQLHATDRQPPYAFSWDTTGSGAGTHSLMLRAIDSDGRRAEAQASVVVEENGDGALEGLPAGWQSLDIGPVAFPGATGHSNGQFTVTGSGADIWGTADAFRFVFRPLAGDGTITARVTAVSGSEPWTKVGVMIRASTATNAPHAFSFVSIGHGTAYQRRTSAGGSSSHTAGPAAHAPQWVRLRRSGNLVTASVSADGTAWTIVGADVVALPATALVGLAVTSHSDTAVAVGTFDNVTVASTSTTLPPGWQSRDVGVVAAPGFTSASGGTFTMTGASADIWGTADAFHFAYRSLTGDGTITARVRSLSPTDPWAKSGVMIRAALTAESRHAMMIVSPAKGLAFQRRIVDGGASTHTSGGSETAPVWLKLERHGSVVTASVSSDGAAWTVVGTETIDLPDTIYVGLPLTSHNAGAAASATISNVTIAP